MLNSIRFFLLSFWRQNQFFFVGIFCPVLVRIRLFWKVPALRFSFDGEDVHEVADGVDARGQTEDQLPGGEGHVVRRDRADQHRNDESDHTWTTKK